MKKTILLIGLLMFLNGCSNIAGPEGSGYTQDKPVQGDDSCGIILSVWADYGYCDSVCIGVSVPLYDIYIPKTGQVCYTGKFRTLDSQLVIPANGMVKVNGLPSRVSEYTGHDEPLVLPFQNHLIYRDANCLSWYHTEDWWNYNYREFDEAKIDTLKLEFNYEYEIDYGTIK